MAIYNIFTTPIFIQTVWHISSSQYCFYAIFSVGDKFQKEMVAALAEKETQFQNQVYIQELLINCGFKTYRSPALMHC